MTHVNTKKDMFSQMTRLFVVGCGCGCRAQVDPLCCSQITFPLEMAREAEEETTLLLSHALQVLQVLVATYGLSCLRFWWTWFGCFLF